MTDLHFLNYSRLEDDLADEHPIGQCNDGCARCVTEFFPFDLGIEAVNPVDGGVFVHCTKGVGFVSDAYAVE